MDFNETGQKYSPCEWASQKKFSRSEVKGQGHNQTECCNGGGMDFDGEGLRLSCWYIMRDLNFRSSIIFAKWKQAAEC